MKRIEYGRWEIHPGVAEVMLSAPGAGTVVWKRRNTKHEGEVLYHKLWNFWVRAGVKADLAMTPPTLGITKARTLIRIRCWRLSVFPGEKPRRKRKSGDASARSGTGCEIMSW